MARFVNVNRPLQLLVAGLACAIICFISITQAGNVSYVYDELNRVVQVIYEDGTIITYTYDKAGNRLVKDIGFLKEAVSTPSKPTAPASGTAEVFYSYSGTGASSDLGHPVEYLFDWGDGTNSGWVSAGQNASKAWPIPGNYDIKVKARCANHNFIVAGWSESLSVNIVPIQIALQFPSSNAALNSCCLIATHQPKFTWNTNWTFPQYTILLSKSPTDFKTQGVLITKATGGKDQSWTPSATLWKTIMTWSYNKGNVRDIYWKVIGTRSDKKTVESEVRGFRIGDPQVVTINSSIGRTTPRSTSPPIFNFNSNCNLKFRLEFSPAPDFLDPKKIVGFTFIIKDPNNEPVLTRTLTRSQWLQVMTVMGRTGYFRIKAWDGLNRQTLSEVRPFKI